MTTKSQFMTIRDCAIITWRGGCWEMGNIRLKIILYPRSVAKINFDLPSPTDDIKVNPPFPASSPPLIPSYLIYVFKGERFNKQAILDIRTHFKPTEPFQYTQFSSCHPPGVRKGFIKGESLRLLRTNSPATFFVENINQF